MCHFAPAILALCAAFSLSACSPDPKNVNDQTKILMTSKSDKQKVKAVENIRALGLETAETALVPILQGPPKPSSQVILASAKALAGSKNPKAVDALCEAIDMSAGSENSGANAANKEIARALTDIGDPRAASHMARLLKVTRDNYVSIEAIAALAKFKDPSTADVLIATAENDRLEAMINKKALAALGELKTEKALPTFIWMLFYERRGTSFFPESAMGIFRLGDKAVRPLVDIIEGKDKELLAKAKEEKMNPAALVAKAAQVLGDLGSREAVPGLIKLLKYANADDLRAQYFVRMAAADSLGRLRAKEAVKPLQSMLGEEETMARQTYIRALFMIGDPSTASKLTGCASKDHWLLRDVCMYGLAMLSPAKDAKLFDGYEKNARKLFMKDCEEFGIFGEIDCVTEGKKDFETMKAAMKSYRKAIEVAGACGRDRECLAKNLEHAEPRVRERAAYELGRMGKTESVAPLLKAIHRPMETDKDVAPRFAAILGLDWATRDDAEARAAARQDIPALLEQVEKEKTKKLSQASAEDIQRLVAKLERE